MNASNISTLIRFNIWANDRLLTACENLSDELFARDVEPDPGWGSLRGILVHALDTEYGWRSILQGRDANTILHATDFAHVGSLRARWQIENAAWIEYLSQLEREINDRGGSGGDDRMRAIWQTVAHVLIHSVQHRSEAALILTGCGHSPGGLDFDVFLKEGKDSPLS